MTKKTRILIVDDHAILLDGIQSILAKVENVEVAAIATNGVEGLQMLKETNAELVITDLNMPEIDGLEFIKEIRTGFPLTKIIVLSLHDEAHYIKSVMKQRVQGYILKNETSKELLTAVDRVLQGKTFLSDQISQIMMGQMNQPTAQQLLTDRELQIIKLICEELTSKQIAEKLFVSENTVETHRKNIFHKTKTNNIVGLIKFAYANNLMS